MSIAVQHRKDSRANCEAATPLDGEIWQDQTLKTLRTGDGAKLGGHLLKRWGEAYVLPPAQITADQNNYNPTDLHLAEVLYLDLDANRTITGLAGGADNRELTIHNASAFRLTLANASVSSSAANRFAFASDVVVRAGTSLRLLYVAALSRWIALGRADLSISSLPEDFNLPGDIMPAQITANQNNYNPPGLALASRISLSSDASRNITGLAGGADGRVMILINAGANAIVLMNADSGSSAANRFDFSGDVTLAAKQAAVIQWDLADSRWKLLSTTAGAAVADGAVIARTLAQSGIVHGPVINGYLDWSVAANAMTVSVKTLAGADPSAADPVHVWIHSTAGTNGAMSLMTLTAALSLTISTGSSLGTTNGTAFRLWAVLFNNDGAPALGIINCRSGGNVHNLAGWCRDNATAEGGAGGADSAQVIYSASELTSKVYAILGYASWESGLASAGAWSDGPTRVQMFGPGVPVPGQTIAKKQVMTSTDTTTTATTYQDTNVAVSITLSSAANLVEVQAVGVGLTNVNGERLSSTIFRGATDLNVSTSLLFSATGQGNLYNQVIDHPNVNPAAYMVKIKSTNGNSVQYPVSGGAAGRGVITATEIMG